MKLAEKNINELRKKFIRELTNIYSEGEAEQITFLTLEHVLNISKIDLVLKKEEPVSEKSILQLESMLDELLNHRPVQYIIGSTNFYGCKIKVNEQVLIPRQETEELVDWIVKSLRFTVYGLREEAAISQNQFSILDICTGSGCIAIALKKNIPSAKIFASDISEGALKVALKNAEENNCEITFVIDDVLTFKNRKNIFHENKFDIIVSNPPYVVETEKEMMEKRVLDYEPHDALFVPNNDPLIFYERIADFALENLTGGGKLYFEINESKGNEVRELLISKGFTDVELKKDLQGKDRMIRCVMK